jgi:hypothetical protein
MSFSQVSFCEINSMKVGPCKVSLYNVNSLKVSLYKARFPEISSFKVSFSKVNSFKINHAIIPFLYHEIFIWYINCELRKTLLSWSLNIDFVFQYISKILWISCSCYFVKFSRRCGYHHSKYP